MKTKMIIAASAALLLGVPVAQAADKDMGGFYVLGAVGQSKMTDLTADRQHLGNGMDVDNTDTAYKLQLGYRINRWIGFEGGYFDLGKSTLNIAGQNGQNGRQNTKVNGWSLSVVPSFPLGDDFLLLTKIGVAYTDGKLQSPESTGGPVSSSHHKGALVLGMGLNYSVSDEFEVRAEYEWYYNIKYDGHLYDSNLNQVNTNDIKTNIGVWSLGAAYRF